MLFQRGDQPHGFYFVVSGQVKLAFSSSQGTEKVVEIIGPMQSFGEAVMFMNHPYPVFAEALTDTVLVHVGQQVVTDLIDQDSTFAHKLLAGMAIRLHGLIQDVETYSLRSSAQRESGSEQRFVALAEQVQAAHRSAHAAAHVELVACGLRQVGEADHRALDEHVDEVLEDTDELKITAGECRLRGHALQEAAQIGIAAIDLFAVKLVAHQADGDDSTVRVTLYERHAKLRPQPPALRRSGGSQSLRSI